MFLFCSLSSLLLVFALRLWYLYFCRQDIWEFKLRNSIREITDGVANSPLQIPNSQLRIQSQEPNSGIQHVEFRVATLNSHLEISKFKCPNWEFKFRNFKVRVQSCHPELDMLNARFYTRAHHFWKNFWNMHTHINIHTHICPVHIYIYLYLYLYVYVYVYLYTFMSVVVQLLIPFFICI